MRTNLNSLDGDEEGLETTVPGVQPDGLVLPQATDAATLDRGATLGRYTVLERIGAGGMGVVYGAFDPQLDRKVALKVMHPNVRGEADTGGRSRLLREAQAMAKLSHPNVITVHDVGTFGTRVFVAMEFIDGTTLREWQQQHDNDWHDLVEAYVKAGRGLAAAHAAGLVHRDFKPDNVLIGVDGRVLVMDFGLARPTTAPTETQPVSEDPDGTKDLRDVVLTRTGALLGTPAYMAPEQHKGGKPDPHADQFSFCVALYEALYGERPFEGNSVTSLAMNVLEGQLRAAPKNSGIPTWLRNVVVRGLSTDPEDRLPSMDALLAELQRDPVEKRTPWVGLGIALGIAGLITVAYLATRPPVDDQCAAGAAAVDGVWNVEASAATRAAMTSTTLAHGETTAQALDIAFGEWLRQWKESYAELCRAHVRPAPRGPQPEDVPALICLEIGRVYAGAIANTVREPDPLVVLNAALAAETLPLPSECADHDGLMATDLNPTPRQLQIRSGLAQARALLVTGRPSQAIERADGLTSGAAALGDPGLQALALLIRGQSHRALGEYRLAESALEEAVVLAGDADLARLEGEIWIELADLVGHARDHRGEGQRLALAAQAALARAGNPQGPLGRLALTRGRIAAAAGRFEEARAELDHALALSNRAGASGTVSSSSIVSALGLAQEGLGVFDHAIESHARALQAREAALGSQHPLVGQSLGYLGSAMLGADLMNKADASFVRARWVLDAPTTDEPWPHVDPSAPDGAAVHSRIRRDLANIEDRAGLLHRAREEFPEAKESHRRAADLLERELGENHRELGYPLNNLGLAHADQGQHREALPLFRRAVQIWTEALPPSHPDLAVAHLNVGNSLIALGQLVEAQLEYERALDVWEHTLPGDHPLLAYALTGIGRCALALDDLPLAIDQLERALGLRDREGEDRLNLAETSLALARALWADRRDPTRARELATRARDLVGAIEPSDPAGLDRLLDGEEVPRLTDQLAPAGLAASNLNPPTSR